MIQLALALCAMGDPVLGVWVAKGYPGDWETTASSLLEAGVDHVLPCLLYGITPAYRSELVPDSPVFPADTAWVDNLLTECTERGLEVHAWVVLWKASNADSALLERLAGEGRLQVSIDGDTLPWLCPTDPRNLDLEASLIGEMMDRFPLDGVQLDYVRFPNSNTCYCEGCRERFTEQTGLAVATWPEDVSPAGPLRDQYLVWRAERITHAVTVFSSLVRSRLPVVSAAVLPDRSDALACGQDWVQWCGTGLLDRLYPMNYFATTAELEAALSEQMQLLPPGFFTVCGLGSSIGALDVSADEAASQVEVALSTGVQGTCHFHLNATLMRMLPALSPGGAAPTVR